MRYALSLHMGYRYESPVSGARHMLRVAPLALPGRQSVSALAVTVSPEPDESRPVVGFFGETALSVALRAAHDRLDIRMQAQVDVSPPPELSGDGLPLDRLGAALAAEARIDAASPHHFTGPSPRLDRNAEIGRWFADCAADDPTLRTLATRINGRIHAGFRYDPTATDVASPVDQAFRLKRGVCQDFAHVMIVALRHFGVPAGYVSGYLRTLPPPGQARLEGADAMHAWVRVWCGPEDGWVEFDPTNDRRAGMDHIVVAYGRDYADVSPVVGVLKSIGSHSAFQRVDVVPV